MKLDLENLKAKAKAASPGPWIADVELFHLRAKPNYKDLLVKRLAEMEEIARLNPLLTDNNQTQMVRLIQSLSMMVYLFDQGDGLSYQRVLKILEGEN